MTRKHQRKIDLPSPVSDDGAECVPESGPTATRPVWEVQGAPKIITPAAPAEPAALALPTVEEVARVAFAGRYDLDPQEAVREWDRADAYAPYWHRTAQAVLDLIAARVPVWQQVEPGTVIKAGTRFHVSASGVAAHDFEAGTETFIDPRTVPAEPEDPKVALVVEWLENIGSEQHTEADARELLARLDAVEG